MDAKLIHLTNKRLEQICSSLVSEGWTLVISHGKVGCPANQHEVIRTFRHRNGGRVGVFVSGATIEIYRNGRLRHSECVSI